MSFQEEAAQVHASAMLYGSPFEKALADAALRGDDWNRSKVKSAFPQFWDKMLSLYEDDDYGDDDDDDSFDPDEDDDDAFDDNDLDGELERDPPVLRGKKLMRIVVDGKTIFEAKTR